MAARTTAKARKPETRTALVRRARKINRVLAETYPDAHCELDFSSPLELARRGSSRVGSNLASSITWASTSGPSGR